MAYSFSTGTRLGNYEILESIGRGGMGEVYKAKDTRLDRTVAVKVLPEHLANDPARRERFEREARTISQLNHPNICMLHDVGEQDGVAFLVMEYIEGDTLAERLERGALPLAEALAYGVQIADALDKAHRASVVHRDLKPGNIMTTKPGAKLLDFGLAKLLGDAGGEVGSALATRQKPLTEEGTVLGTFQYMAPEQLEGKDADARTDIFAFGALLYEMVSGRKAFEGKSQASLISAIMSAEPPALRKLEPLTPPSLERLNRICLAKDPDERWQSAAELAWIRDGGGGVDTAPAKRGGGDLVKGLVAGAVAATLVAASLWGFLGVDSEPQVRIVRSTIELPPGLELEPSDPIALSPDGELLAYAATDGDGQQHLYLRRLDAYEATLVSGTEGARSPFFSPDGNWVGLYTRQGLQKVSVGGGAVVTLTRESGPGATWSADGQWIVLSAGIGAERGLLRIPSDGGEPEVLTMLDDGAGEHAHAYPNALPNGIVFRVWSNGPSPIKTVSLETGDTVPLTTGEYLGAAQYSPTGHLIYGSTTRDRPYSFELVALPFDLTRGKPVGPPQAILEGVWSNRGTTNPNFAISQNGTLAYVPAGAFERTLVWVDREARETSLWEDGNPAQPRLSPDGRRIALTESGNVWVLDVDRGTRAQIETSGRGPVWTPDGRSVTFRTNRSGSWTSTRSPPTEVASPSLY